MILPADVTVRPGAIATALRQLQTEASGSYPDDTAARIQLILQKRKLEESQQEIIRLKQRVERACPKSGARDGVSGPSEGDQHSTNACKSWVPVEESPYRIYFNSGRAELTPTERQVVAFVVNSWHEHGRPAVAVAGYTDPAGMDSVNSQLRARRASLVAAALKSESSGELQPEIVNSGPSIPGLAKIKDKDERARVALIWFKS
jgi:outer membrane protein OmpA-like peptidoglycan-associated protein